MTNWSFKKRSIVWTFSIDTGSAKFDLKFHGGAFRKLNQNTLLQVEGGLNYRSGISLQDDDNLKILLPIDSLIRKFYIKMDKPSAAALRNYITNMSETEYDEYNDFNNNSNNNDDVNMLTEHEYVSVSGDNDPTNNAQNSNNALNPIGGSRRKERKTIKRKRNIITTRRWKRSH